MAGIIITSEATTKKALKIARTVARESDYTLERIEAWTFRAKQGSLALSIFVGAFVAYCNFLIEIQDGRHEGETDIIINRNSPWWTGLIGVGRVKNRAKDLAAEIANAIRHEGIKIVKKKTF